MNAIRASDVYYTLTDSLVRCNAFVSPAKINENL